jgi:glutamate/tyrosine decarboxylase-like PLP-dependent enzyme
MDKPDWSGPLTAAYEHALRYLADLPERAVRTGATPARMREALGGPLPAHGLDPSDVISTLASAAEPGLMPSGSGRFFGFVVGGAAPVALAADWLTSTWDQNAGLYALGPAASTVESVAGEWLTELFGLPASASVGFVTGTQLAHVTALAAARHAVLRRFGWDVERDGLTGAPPLTVFAGAERHVTIDRALRFLGLGTAAVRPVASDGQGRMRAEELRGALQDHDGPAIVCAQAGHINTGAFDPIDEICDAAAAADAWVHVDGAFGLWAAATPKLRPMLAGLERADSWATDAHKLLNVPYDSGIVICADPQAHQAAMGVRAGYLIHGAAEERDALDFTPEFSRRARGFAVYAALRALGRMGVQRLVERSCELAGRFADQLREAPGIEVLNEVVLNQVVVRFRQDGDDEAAADRRTQEVIRRVQDEGTCWVSGTTWNGRAVMRISVTNWSTDEHDVDVSADAIVRSAASMPQ